MAEPGGSGVTPPPEVASSMGEVHPNTAYHIYATHYIKGSSRPPRGAIRVCLLFLEAASLCVIADNVPSSETSLLNAAEGLAILRKQGCQNSTDQLQLRMFSKTPHWKLAHNQTTCSSSRTSRRSD